MKAVGLHPDVVVVTSRVWQTTCTLVRSGERGVLHRLAGAARRARAAAGDRAAGRLPRGRLPRRRTPTGTTCSAATRSPTRRSALPESTAARLRNEPGAAQRELRDFDDEHYVERPGPLSLAGGAQSLPVPGHCGIGERELELHPADGHTVDGMAVVDPVGGRARVRRLPLAGRDPVDLRAAARRRAYLATLGRLEPLVEQAEHVVPGHGAVMDSRARRRRSCARTAPTSRRCSSAAPTRRCRSRAAAARSGASTRRTSRAWPPAPDGAASEVELPEQVARSGSNTCAGPVRVADAARLQEGQHLRLAEDVRPTRRRRAGSRGDRSRRWCGQLRNTHVRRASPPARTISSLVGFGTVWSPNATCTSVALRRSSGA